MFLLNILVYSVSVVLSEKPFLNLIPSNDMNPMVMYVKALNGHPKDMIESKLESMDHCMIGCSWNYSCNLFMYDSLSNNCSTYKAYDIDLPPIFNSSYYVNPITYMKINRTEEMCSRPRNSVEKTKQEMVYLFSRLYPSNVTSQLLFIDEDEGMPMFSTTTSSVSPDTPEITDASSPSSPSTLTPTSSKDPTSSVASSSSSTTTSPSFTDTTSFTVPTTTTSSPLSTVSESSTTTKPHKRAGTVIFKPGKLSKVFSGYSSRDLGEDLKEWDDNLSVTIAVFQNCRVVIQQLRDKNEISVSAGAAANTIVVSVSGVKDIRGYC